MTFRRAAAVVLAGGAMVLLPSLARADITAFVGSIRTASSQNVRGVAVGGTLIVVGVEFEYANAPEDVAVAMPGLSTGTISALVRTPTGRIQVYGTAGVGVYRETLGILTNTNTTGCVGGGVTIGIAGPLRVRIDYRVITLRNSMTADTSTRQRVYAGVNVKF
jgi:opacity protein-like surface antigen